MSGKNPKQEVSFSYLVPEPDDRRILLAVIMLRVQVNGVLFHTEAFSTGLSGACLPMHVISMTAKEGGTGEKTSITPTLRIPSAGRWIRTPGMCRLTGGWSE